VRRWHKLIAAGLAVALHLPLFWQSADQLQRGEGKADTASQSGVVLKLAARPAPPPAKAPAQPIITPKPTPLPKPAKTKPKPALAPPPETQPPAEPVVTRESSQENIEEQDSTQQQPVGGQTMGLAGASVSGANETALARYKGIIHSRIQRLHQYPQQARLRKQQGTVEVTFAVAADGKIADYRISRSSGSMLLDRAAERLFSRLTLPAPEPSILSDLAELTVPVTFELKDR
jgi:protein TonB